LTKALDRSLKKAAEKHDELWQPRLNKWTDKIRKYEVFRQAIIEEKRQAAAFNAKLLVARVQEEHEYVDHRDRVVVYDAKEKYNELLSKVFDPKAASCCYCLGCGDGGGELNFLPCRHVIHDDSLSFNRWYHSPLLNDLKCPKCKRRINVLEVPPCPLTQRYWGKVCDSPGGREVMRPSHMDETDEEEKALVRAGIREDWTCSVLETT
jgi:hypothetical protein